MIGLLNLKVLLISGIALVAFALMATGVFAKGTGGTRPGWGYGDTNHIHTGPPGQSVHP